MLKQDLSNDWFKDLKKYFNDFKGSRMIKISINGQNGDLGMLFRRRANM